MTLPAGSTQQARKSVTPAGDRQAVAGRQALGNSLLEHLSTPSGEAVSSATIRASADQILEDVPFFARMAPNARTRQHLLDCLEKVPLPAPMALQLAVARDRHHEIYLQLVRAALVAAWLARTPALPRCDPAMASAAGLLHDIGMLHVDPQILDPDNALTRQQRRQLYSHPLVASALLARQEVYPSEVIRAVGEHQECLDASGYPRGLAGDAISPLGKLLSLAQVVAAMFAPGRSSPEMRLSVLLRMTWHRYDNAMAMQVLSLLKPHLDVMSAELQLLDDPIAHLCTIDHLLRQWPLPLGASTRLSTARAQALETLAVHAVQIQRVLAGVGAVPEQLRLLTPDAQDDALLGELTLLTREACWQLRTLALQCRRRWHLEPHEDFPPVLQQWLDAVGALVLAVSGVAHENPQDPDPPGSGA